MPGALKITQKTRRRAAKAARCLTAACELLENRCLLSGHSPLVSVGDFIPSPKGESPQAAVTFDANGNLWGTTAYGGPNGNGTVYEIPTGNSTVTTVATFNGSNGANPEGAVTFDSSGNLWGTTYGGGASSDGTVFEIPLGSSTITTFANFNGTNGKNPAAGVTFDASGNLWGTTYYGGDGVEGTVFKIAHGSNTITTVEDFNGYDGYDGEHPSAAVTFDASGNLWGTTAYGGSNSSSSISPGFTNYGTVFEIKGSSIYNVFSFNGSGGAIPEAAVTVDGSGNVWGTTCYGGASYSGALTGYGTVFEITKSNSTMTTATYLYTTVGINPQAALTPDASGNLWGTTTAGGAAGNGTVFEIAKASGFNIRASFGGTNGANSTAPVTFDTSGNLWGTTYNGGSGNVGAVFEITSGTTTISTEASFNAIAGQNPQPAVTFDTSGNLWGTTYVGGASNYGTVFEIAKGSSVITTVASFNGANGAYSVAAVTFDTSGNLWGTTYGGGASNFGTVFEIVKGSNTITSVASFNGSNGLLPVAPVTFDANGNLWGTTGDSTLYSGTVFEIVKGSTTITAVAHYIYSRGPVTFDNAGNLWGEDYGNDRIFEIAKGSSTVSAIGNLNASTGTFPDGGLTFDTSGNLWGTTSKGGAYTYGTIFEITKFNLYPGSNGISVLASFNGSNGKNSYAPVAFDPSGNLWGTTYAGGANGDGTLFELVKGGSTITTIASFNGANGANSEAGVAFDASGNIWGTAYFGGAASAGTVWELPLTPSWLSDPAGNDVWNTASHTLIVNDPSTIIADPGADQPIIQANGPSAVVTINPSTALQIHLDGLSLTNGASAVVTSLGAARTATNHRVLVIGQAGATSAPLFTIDATSKLDLTDNDLVDHDGSLASVSALLTTGFAGGWTGHGIVSSKASGSAIDTLGVGQPASAGTFDGEAVATSDVEFRYTYYGDANLDGHVDGSDYSKIDSGLLNHLTGWSNGDFNYDGAINGSDYTLIDNAFNMQGASLAASIALPMTSTTVSTMRVTNDAAAAVDHVGNRLVKSQFVLVFPDIFTSRTPIILTESKPQSFELLIQKQDLLDQLMPACEGLT